MYSLRDKIRLRKYYEENREIVKERVKKWCKEHPKKRKQIAKRWYLKNRERRKEYVIEWQGKNRDRVNKYKRKSYHNNPESRKNNLLAQKRHHSKSRFNGLREFRLKKDKYFCQMCGSKEKLHVHHKKYGKIEIDDLITLCNSCHMRLHKNLKKERKN